MKQQEALVVGGVLAGGALLAYAVSKAGSQSSGVAYQQINPSSVAAVESGVSSQIAAMNQGAIDKAKIASDTLLGLVGAKTGLLTAQINASEALSQAQIASETAIQTTQLNTEAATSQAQIAADASVKAATALGSVQQSIAQIDANAQTEIARNQTTQAQAQAGAQKTSSFWGALAGIAGAVLHFFNPAPSQQPTSTPVPISYSPEVGPAPLPGVAA